MAASPALAGTDDNRIARELAKKARVSRASGEIVRPFLLYSEAAKRDPKTLTYRQNRDKLAPVATLLIRTNLEAASIAGDVADAEHDAENAAKPSEEVVLQPAPTATAPVPSVVPNPAVPAAVQSPTEGTIESVAAPKAPNFLGHISTSLRFREDSAISEKAPYHLTENRTYAYFDLSADLWSSKSGAYQIAFNSSVRAFYDSVFDFNHFYPGAVRTNEAHQVDLRRAVVTFTGPGWTIHAGRQQVVWGEAVGLFIADVVNPKDYRQFLVPDMDDIRMPLWGIDATKDLGKAGKLELFWSPDTAVSKLPVAGSEFTFFAPTTSLPTETMYAKPAATLGNSRIGLRYSWLKSGWDSSLFYLHSIDDVPATSTALMVGANPIVSIIQRYPQLDNFAATTSKPLGDFVFKAEAIYTRGTQFESTTLGPAIGRDTVSGMLGFSHSLCCQYLLDVQYFQTSLTGSASQIYSPRLRNGVSVRIADVASLRRIKPSLQTVVSINQHDYWISPKLTVRLTSSLFATFGFDWFGGAPETLFGQFRDSSRLELSLYWKAK